LEAVSAGAGCSKTAVYKHFPSKEDLFLALAEEDALRQVDEVRAVARREGGATLDAFTPWLDADPGAVLAAHMEFMARVSARPDLHARVVALHAELDARAAAMLAELCANRRRQPPMPLELLVLTVWALASGLVLRSKVDPALDVEGLLATALDALIDGGPPLPGGTRRARPARGSSR
jgi:AcrR family transcriptional regulator